MIGDSLSDILLKFGNQNIGGIIPDVVVEENLVDSVTITDHPVELGADISDHAIINPCEITLKIGWTDSKSILAYVTGQNTPSIDDAYARLLKLKDDRQPFDVATSKRTYQNMLVRVLSVTTDVQTNSVLMVTAVLRQVIIVATRHVDLEAKNQKNPEDTAPVENQGAVSPRQVPDGTAKAVQDEAKKL